VSYEDRVAIATPEGVELDLVVAGLGSRFIAISIDTLIQCALLFGVWAVAGSISTKSGWAAAFATTGTFLVLWGYFTFFEGFNAGRTPGKMVAGLRTTSADGTALGFGASAVRNLVRFVDFLPFFYGVGMISIFATAHDQRLGDLAAGTLVLRERREADSFPAPVAAPRPWTPVASDPAAPPWTTWDVSAVNVPETTVAQQFLWRRWEIEWNARVHLGSQLAARLRPKVGGELDGLPDEAVIEGIVAAKSTRA
jgi:uncharacterized RDD family membrane protein YckC